MSEKKLDKNKKPRLTAPIMRGLKILKDSYKAFYRSDPNANPDITRAFEWIDGVEPYVKPSNDPPNFKLKDD